MGYATEKPVPLLERIIKASSNPSDVVFDPFCGCATTLEAAHRLDRRLDRDRHATHAIKRVARVRLQEKLGLQENKDFTIEGVPRNLEGTRDLWQQDEHHFQKWAVEQVDGFVTTKRSADGGVDGRIYFPVTEGVRHRSSLQSMVIEVKGGRQVTIQEVRALRGVLERDEAVLAGLIIMDPLGKTQDRNFRRYMAEAGDLEVQGTLYPRMQMLTVPEIFDGRRFNTPGVVGRSVSQPVLPGIGSF